MSKAQWSCRLHGHKRNDSGDMVGQVFDVVAAMGEADRTELVGVLGTSC